ncbi:MAG: hypothetical protein GX417_07560 [Clostridiales bacterium]|nr:hypothetical protein [Clostridiales bacterium]
MPKYYVNREDYFNPNHDHEVHVPTCRYHSSNSIYLGEFPNAIPAVEKAKGIYADADGCKDCCPEAHHR